MPTNRYPVVCSDCESAPILKEDPVKGKYVLECECLTREIDVTDGVSDSSLVEPFTGMWSNIDRGSSIYPHENPVEQYRRDEESD